MISLSFKTYAVKENTTELNLALICVRKYIYLQVFDKTHFMVNEIRYHGNIHKLLIIPSNLIIKFFNENMLDLIRKLINLYFSFIQKERERKNTYKSLFE